MLPSTYIKSKNIFGDIILNPIPSIIHKNTLIFFHGYGDSPYGWLNSFYPKSELVDPTTKVILMHSPKNKRNKNSWFAMDVEENKEELFHNFNDVINSSKRIIETMKKEAEIFNVNYSKIFLGGFSQGACLSLHIAFNFEFNIGGVIALSGQLFSKSFSTESIVLKNPGRTKFFIGHGTEDDVIPVYYQKKSFIKLRQNNDFEFHYYENMRHKVNLEELNDINTFCFKYMK